MGKLLLGVVFCTSLAAAQIASSSPPFLNDAANSGSAAALAKDTAATPESTAASVSAVTGGAATLAVARPTAKNLSQRCWAKVASRDECKVHWGGAIGETWLHMTVLAAGLIAKDDDFRNRLIDNVSHGTWTQRWIDSASNYWFWHWDQDSPWKDNYIGHPWLGAIQQGVWVQNDPYAMTMQWDNSREYWKSRLRALPLTVAADFEWKMGPISEASIGNSGYGHNKGKWRYLNGRWANNTGLAPLVTTPVGGFLWFWGEDVLDRHLLAKLEAKSHNPLYLFAISFVNPARGAANLLRFKAPWYRPYRQVKAEWHRKPRRIASVSQQ